MTGRWRGRGGFTVPEFVAGIGLLVIPAAMLVVVLPLWAEVVSMGRVAARQAARAAAAETDDAAARTAARGTAATVVANHGRRLAAPVRLRGTVEGAVGGPQQLVTVEVPVRLPALALPLVGELGGVTWTARASEPVAVYRSVP